MRVQRPTQPVTTGKKKYSWGKIFADDDGGSGNLSSESLVHSMLGFGSGAMGLVLVLRVLVLVLVLPLCPGEVHLLVLYSRQHKQVHLLLALS